MSGNHRLKSLGKLIIERITNLASVVYDTTYDRGRIVYDNTTQQIYFGSNQTASFRTLYDIPLNTIVLFEANTARLGYSLLTTLNDYVVYATRGSVAGGEAGASNKSGGTWTQPSHTHSLMSHSHTASHTHTTASHAHTGISHNHRWLDYVNSSTSYSWDSSGYSQIAYSSGGLSGSVGMCVASQGDGHIDCALGDFWTYIALVSVDPGGSIDSASPSTTAAAGSSGSGAPVNTWRPSGLNYTRQQRV